MKKLALLTTVGLLAFGANAQSTQSHVIRANSNSNVTTLEKYTATPASSVNRASLSQVARTTATPFYTETFGSGTTTTLPTGWTATGNSSFPGTWKWRNVACTGQFNIGVINSTTAANGWMVYDSDSLGDLSPAVPIEGWLTSGTISCTGHSTVELSFEEWFRKFQDSCFVEVSNNGGTSWTQFPLLANNTMPNNTNLPSNSYKMRLNISSVAANQANVKIRFYYRGRYSGGSFNWLVDDVALAELDPTEVGIENSGVLCFGGANVGWTSFATMPLQLVDTLHPITFMNNFGANVQASVPVTAKIYNGTNQVFTQTASYSGLPVSAVDSLVDFTNDPGYLPNATGSYTIAYSINPTGDTHPENNIDTARFAISDSVWSANQGSITGGYYIHRAASGGNSELSFSIGTIFRMPAGKTDTLTGASVCFNSQTTPGANLAVQIYTFDAGTTSWAPVATTSFKTLTAADISTSSAAAFAYFPADVSSGIAPLILSGGTDGTTFAAIVTGKQIPTSSTVVINSTKAPVPTVAGTIGVEDTSQNDGAFTFASSGLPGGISGVAPMVRMHFAGAHGLSVNEVFAGEGNVNAYPNPADNNITVSFKMNQAADVNVKIVNTLGQTVNTQQFSKVGKGETRNAVFSTSALATGIYFYTVEANGARVTKRFVVTH